MKRKAKHPETIPAKRNRQAPDKIPGDVKTPREQPAENQQPTSGKASDKSEGQSPEESNKNGSKQPITNQDEQQQITNKGSETPGSF